MISWLKRVIARLLGTQTQPLEAPVQQTQTVGLAPQEPTTPPGSRRSALTTAPVLIEQKPKRSRAQRTTQEASPKRGRTTAGRTAIQVGQAQVAPVSKTNQPAKRGRKPKQNPAQ